ncbi:hypothetical protein I302_105441 [Kwoniella bestiolae CBS 10118]|uniref:Uncharacterized protein n=1 Tax=Kwoniella bestiolae CBS 10118 TaxID=1296100 RepID=A0A1B9FT50_9TREE|nr:hypothetical protein I302_08722 [Kwoniella bestiolae CBS 10118]OCF21942.1 hypothetical protein I302_08722 [Kwoniella bestiolae CBS 10118]
MVTVHTSHGGGMVRGARPEAILIVIFILIALFVFLGGGRKKGQGGGSSRYRNEVRSGGGRGRGGDEESDLESGRPEKSRQGRGHETPTSSDEERDKRNKEKEREERHRKQKEEEEKKKRQAQQQQQQQAGEDQLPPRVDAPDWGPSEFKPLSDKLWQRDPTKRPERPSGRSPPILLKRDENNQWTRPPLSGKKGVTFDDGGVQGKELSSIAAYHQGDPANKIYDQSHLDIKRNHVSLEKGRDGDILQNKIDGSQSPLNELEKTGKLSGKLVMMMRRVEWACQIDRLDLLQQIPKDVLKQSNEIIDTETFIPKIGPIPNALLDIVRQMLFEKVFDLPLVLASQACPNMEHVDPNVPYDGNPDIHPLTLEATTSNFVNMHLRQFGIASDDIHGNLGYDEWAKLSIESIRKIVYEWTEKKLKVASESQGQAQDSNLDYTSRYDVFRLVLGYFLLYYRALVSPLPTHFKQRYKVPGFVERVGPLNAGLVQWFRYIGRCLLVSKVFSETGGEVSPDLSAKVQVSKRVSQVGLIVDYTLFIPKPDPGTTNAGADLQTPGAYYYLVLASSLSKLRKPLERVKHLCIAWAEHLNERVYPPPQQGGNYLFNDIYPFQINRMTFRPGISVRSLDPKALQASLTSRSRQDRAAGDGREKTIMHVSSARILEMFDNQWKPRDTGISEFGALYRSMTCQMVRFINKRQFHWYSDPEGKKVYEKFDENQFEFLLMLVGPSLDRHQLEETYKSKVTGKYVTDKPTMMEYEYGDTIKYSQLQAIDFGGIIPIEIPPPGYASLTGKKFLKLDLFKGLKWILLPIQFKSEGGAQGVEANLYSANLVVNDSYGITNQLYGNPQNSLSITFHGRSPGDRNRLAVELAQTIVEQINGWVKDISSNNPDQQQVKRHVMDRLDLTKRMIRSKVKFVVITPGQMSQQAELENFNDANNLEEFDIPREMLPPALVG